MGNNVVRLGDGLADPRRGALERKGAFLELVVKLIAVVVYATLDYHRGYVTEAHIGLVNAHDVYPIKQKLELIAQSIRRRCLLSSFNVDCLKHYHSSGRRLPHSYTVLTVTA